MRLIGIDIGGTKTSVCLSDEKGDILASTRMSTNSREPLESYYRQLDGLCGEMCRQAGGTYAQIDAVGISAPGPLDVKRGVLIEPPNNPGWRDVPIVEVVRQNTGRPVFFNNDANACALAEQYFGSHRGAQNLVYLTFSTGMGGGIIVNGQLLQGVTDTGGEVGHHVVDIDGPVCGCGMRGCFEAFCGGRNLAERLRRDIAARSIQTSIVKHAGGQIESIDARAFFAAAREGDPYALAEWEQFTDRLAQGVGNLIMILNPEVVILGTMAVREDDFVMQPLKAKLPKYTWKWPLEACQIVPSSLGGRIGDLSAIAVALVGLGVKAR